RALVESVNAISMLPKTTFERAYASEATLSAVQDVLQHAGRLDLLKDDVSTRAPFVAELSPAVAMFGGVSPDLTRRDIEFLCSKLISRQGLVEEDRLSALVASRRDAPLGVPHKDGYNFAADFVDELGLLTNASWIDIRRIANQFGIEICEPSLETETIRGVAIAGEGFG